MKCVSVKIFKANTKRSVFLRAKNGSSPKRRQFKWIFLLDWSILDEKWIELGAKSFEGEVSNNPVYRLAAESKLIDSEESELIEELNLGFWSFEEQKNVSFFISALLDRDECYHDEDAESIDEDVIDEIRQIYDEILEKKIPTYPYENYPDISLGDFISAEFEEYFQMKKPRLDQNDIDERRRVIHWLNKKHPFFSSIPSNNLNEVSVQGRVKKVVRLIFLRSSTSFVLSQSSRTINNEESPLLKFT